jgi:hypothetical protein
VRYRPAILVGLTLLSAGCGAMVPACGKNMVMRRCDDPRPVEAIHVSDGSWNMIPAGPDRIYFRGDRGNLATEALNWVAQSRRVLRELSGVEPGPVGVLLLGSSDSVNLDVARDAEGRRVWAVLPGRDDGPLTVVHEWTHGILGVLRPNDRSNERFVEDGLCDLVAAVVVARVRGGAPTGVDDAARSLRERLPSLPSRANLLTMAAHYDETRRSWKEFCADPPASGYALGLALWLGGTGSSEDAVARAFSEIHSAPSQPLEKIAEAEPGQKLRARDLDVRRALAVLEERR